MMKRIIACLGYVLLIIQSSSVFSAPGLLFDVQGTGGAGDATITLCLDGSGTHPLSCQKHTLSNNSLSIRSTVPGHTYSNACIKVNTPGHRLRDPGVDCTQASNGCCLFSVSDTSPKNITLTPTVPELLLYGITGAGSPSNPNSLYIMNTNTGLGSFMMNLTDDDGAIIASDGSHIYHWTGYDPLSTFERVDLDRLITTTIPFSGDSISEVFGAVFSGNAGSFLVSSIDEAFFTFTKQGVVTQIGGTTSDDYPRGFACYQHRFYAVTPETNALYELDPSTGTTLSTQTITLTGYIVERGLGITANPTTGILYALLKVKGTSIRKLVTIDPATGIATLIGDANDASGDARFSSIAFHPADPTC